MENKEALIYAWYQLREEIDANKLKMANTVKKELELRRFLMATVWRDLKEGVNDYLLPNGYVLKGTHKIDREVEEKTLPDTLQKLQEIELDPDKIFKKSYALMIKPYRELKPETRKIIDQTLIIKPGAPVIELIPPKVVQ